VADHLGYLAVDIGGTKLATAIVAHNGVVVARSQTPTPKIDVWATLSSLISQQLSSAPISVSSVGVGCGGPMELSGEHVSPLNIPDWRSFPLRERLSELTQLPVFIANDAQAIVLGEAWCGAAQGRSDVLGMVVSTGVGGGILSRGNLVVGRLGNAGHIGHINVQPDGRLCACGARGCLEAYASGPSIASITGLPAESASPETVLTTGRYVGRAIASAAAMLDFDLVVIGGSVALGFGGPFFAAVSQEVEQSARLDFIRGVRVKPVGLGADSPLVGAAAVARMATIV
jgi:glucokinase